mgnify:CR=1 FL=1
MAIINFLRILCMSSTILPSLKHYNNKYRLGGINGTGSEYIFSGHASFTTLSAIYLHKYGYDWKLLFIYNFITQGLIIITRNHYTVDIILAWIIVGLVYSNVYLYGKLYKRLPLIL